MTEEIHSTHECEFCKKLIMTNTQDVDKWMSFKESKGKNSTEYTTSWVCPSCIKKIRHISVIDVNE